MTTPDTDLGATLAGILADVRMQAEDHHLVPADMALPLVDALDAVLERHGPGRVTILGSLCKRHEAHRHFSITRTEAAGVTTCPDCTADVYVSCAGCGPHVRLDSCPDRTRIAAALTGPQPGEGTGDGH